MIEVGSRVEEPSSGLHLVSRAFAGQSSDIISVASHDDTAGHVQTLPYEWKRYRFADPVRHETADGNEKDQCCLPSVDKEKPKFFLKSRTDSYVPTESEKYQIRQQIEGFKR
jgi:hypothetical protein